MLVSNRFLLNSMDGFNLCFDWFHPKSVSTLQLTIVEMFSNVNFGKNLEFNLKIEFEFNCQMEFFALNFKIFAV